MITLYTVFFVGYMGFGYEKYIPMEVHPTVERCERAAQYYRSISRYPDYKYICR